MILIIDNQTDEVLDEINIGDKILEAEHTQDAESKEETLDFTFRGHHEGIKERNRLLIKDDDNQYREFVIEKIEQTDDEISVFSNASYLEDLNNAKPIEPTGKNGLTTGEWVDYALTGTDWENGNVEYNGIRSISWTGYNNPYELLTIISNRFDMTLRFRIETDGEKVTSRYVDLVQVNHLFNGKEIVRGKDLVEFKRTVNTEELATALIALGPQPEEGKNRLVEVVIDDEANDKFNKRGKYNWKIYEPESDDENMTRARLRTLATTELNKRKEPTIDYSITAINLEHLYGHEKVRLYDKVRIKDEELDRYAEANTKRITRNLLDKTDREFVFGDIIEYQRETLRAYFNSIINELKQRLENMPNTIDNIIEIVTDSELFEPKISKSETPPNNPQEGDFWLDISDSQVGVLYRWENGEWVKSSVTQAEEIGAVTREAAMYDNIKNTIELLTMLHSDLMSEYYAIMDNEYFIDDVLKNSLTSAYNTSDEHFNAVINKFNSMTVDTATMGRLMETLQLITDYRATLNTLRMRLVAAQQEIDRYFALLQSQYSEEKYNEILNEVADKFGLSVSEDGKLMGDADYINSMNQLEQNLQQQIDDAKQAFDDLKVGGRNLAFKTADLQEQTATSVRLRYDVNNEVLRNNIGKEITISFEAKFDSEKDFDAYIVELPSDYVVKSTRILGGNTEWKKFSFTELIKSEAEFTTNAQFTLATNDYGAIRNLKVELGNISTDWTPAPEDTDNKITNLNQEIININGRLASMVTEETFDLLKGTVTSQGTLLEQTATQLQSKADKSYVDTINNTVTNQGTQITQNATDIQSKAEQSDLNTATGEISRQGTLISQNAQEIAQRAKTEELNELTGRVSTTESTLTQHAKEIASKVNESTYTTDKQGIIGRLSGAESSITQQSKLIETKVGSTELTQAIDDIELGGENLIPYADLPNDRSHWSTWNASTALNTSTSYPDYVWVNDVNGAENASLSAQSPILTEKVIEGQEYTLSFIATDLRNVYEDMRYCYMINNISGQPNHFLGGVKRKEIGLETSYNSSGTPMYLYYVTFKSEITADVKVLVGSRKIDSGGARFYLKHVKLEKGNKPTGFSLSTKGLEDRITTHDTQFEQTDQQIALRATMTDVNKSDETLSRALSELVIDTANGLKFQWDSNGRLASYSVGKDGIQFDGSKIRFKAQDSIMLQIADAKKSGDDAQNTIDNLELGGANLVKGTSVATENLKYLTSVNGGTSNVAPTVSGLEGVPYYLIREQSGASPSYIGVRINDAANQRFRVQEGKKYVLTFIARKSTYTNDFGYTYLIRPNAEGGNYKLPTPQILESSYTNAKKYVFTFTAPWTTSEAHILLGLHPSYSGGSQWFRFRELQLQEGDRPTAYAPQPDEVTTDTTVISQINLDSTSATISASKINLVGDVNITNGRTVISDAFINDAKVKHLYSSSENNHLQLTGNGLVMSNASGVLDINTAGVVYKDTSGKIRYRMDPTYVSSAALGTTNANVYLAADVGYEVRFVDVSQVPSDGLVNSYRYVDYRGKVGYVGGLANNPAITTHLDLGADGEVRIMNNGRTTYGVARAGAVHAHSFNWSTSGNNSNNLYIRPSSAGEVRFTAVNTTTNYSNIRAAKVYSDSVWSHRFADYWIRVDGEVILSAHGSTSNYRDIRGMFAKFDALDVNTGSHIYTRVRGASAELRVTARGTTDQYRNIRFRKWTSVSSEIYKTDITEWNYNVLDIIKNEIKIYQYKYKDDVTEGKNVMYQRGLVLERETPSEFIEGDGINQYEVTSWTLKGIQELAQENDELKNEVDNLKEEISDLNKRLKVIEDMLK